MRNLLSFIRKNHFFILFFLLEFFSISLVINNNVYQRASYINSSNTLVGSVLSFYSAVASELKKWGGDMINRTEWDSKAEWYNDEATKNIRGAEPIIGYSSRSPIEYKGNDDL